ncbi:MAG: gamma-glutamyltransferase [Rhodothermales bacterium]
MRSITLAVLLAVFTLPAAGQSGQGDRIHGPNFASRSPALGVNGMASTSHPVATQVAVDILKEGGSAVDAAIAANAVLGFVESNNSGIGGDLFAIVWDEKSGELHGLNASGRSSQHLSYDDLRERLGDAVGIPLYGPLSISVPGAVNGWYELHDRFGSLSMEDVLAPAIHHAREGVPMNDVVAFSWQQAYQRLKANEEAIGEFDNFEETFVTDGRMADFGEIFRNPDLARTYERIAEGGRDAFYEGEIADAIDAYARRTGIPIRKSDLQAHAGTWVDPISTTYRGYEVYELPPNGQGLTVVQMLNILEGFDLASMGHNTADYLHVLIEAKKLAFADRAVHYADPDFADIPLGRLLSKDYAADQRAQIDMNRAMDRVDTGALGHGDTVYLTVADGDGNMVSLIQSNFLEFGSGMVPDDLGFVFQSRGSQFSLDPDHANVYEPGKRPFHTIIPAFAMRDGEPFMAFGVMGGPFQPQGHVQVFLNVVEFGMNVQAAGDAARFSHSSGLQPTGGTMVHGGNVAFESGIPAEVQLDLAHRGHIIAPTDFFGGYQAVIWDAEHGVYHGGADRRKDGSAIGY